MDIDYHAKEVILEKIREFAERTKLQIAVVGTEEQLKTVLNTLNGYMEGVHEKHLETLELPDLHKNSSDAGELSLAITRYQFKCDIASYAALRASILYDQIARKAQELRKQGVS